MKKLVIDRSKKTETWFKEEADRIRNLEEDMFDITGQSYNHRDNILKNYNIYKGILNPEDYTSTLRPFGEQVKVEISEEIENEDISSGKIKAVLGMEMKRPFPYKVIAVNSEASSRKEEAYTAKIKDFVVNSIMQPIREQAEMKAKQQAQGKELTPEEAQQIKQSIEQEIESMKPAKVKRYMERDHEDIAEIAGNHILSYLRKKENLDNKLTKCFLYGLLAGYEAGYVGASNGHPTFTVIKPENLVFTHVESGMVEEAEKIMCRYYLSPSEILTKFNREIKKKDIERIYESDASNVTIDDFDFSRVGAIDATLSGIRVEHCLWKGVRKIQEIATKDVETGVIDISIEDEDYKFNPEAGDVSSTAMYIPEIYETWVICLSDPIYLRMRPYPGQSFDPEDVYNKKMPYKGILYDALGGKSVALMDRLSGPQVFYNIVKTQLKRLIKSDKGKKLLLNIGVIPTSQGIDTTQFMNYFENSPFALINPNEEGGSYNDINTSAKVIDMSLISDIQKYMMILQDIKRGAGTSVGITEQVEGQISANEAVTNTKQSLMQSSQILEPYFNLHNQFKKQVLSGLLERAKVEYRENPEIKLAYVTDDVTIQMFKFDGEFFSFQKLGVFITDNAKVDEIRSTLQSLALAAMQNQKAELSDVISVFKVESLSEAEEILKVAEKDRIQKEDERQAQMQQAEMQKLDKMEQLQVQEHERKKDIITHTEEERRKTEVVKGAIMASSYNPDTDLDKDGVNDFVEMATKIAKIDMEGEKIGIAKEKLALDKKKVENDIKNSNKINK
jgi:hypothetical protein